MKTEKRNPNSGGCKPVQEKFNLDKKDGIL
jgi:hypothetical protein